MADKVRSERFISKPGELKVTPPRKQRSDKGTKRNSSKKGKK